MREIDLNSPAPPWIRALVLGAPKSGKTHFASTFPDCLFLADAAEGGYATLTAMDRNLWWNPGKAPTVWAIEDILKDLGPLLVKLEVAKAEGKFPFQTIIVDPVSLYADRAFTELYALAARGAKNGVDGRQVYGDLMMHMRGLILRVHALPAHILWLCHVKEGGLALSGSTAEKLPAYVDYTWLCTNMQGSGYQLHTAPMGAFQLLGGRYTWANSKGQRFGLPNPIVPSFKAIAQAMKLNIQPSHPAVPGYPEGVNYQWPPEE